MLDDEFPEEVRRLKPRKVRFIRDVERLLGSMPSDRTDDAKRSPQALRPEPGSQNSICCAACGQSEYLSRPYCRCGHYLHGQIEDEYLAWERDLRGMHEIIARDAERKLKPLRWLALVAIPFLIGPMLVAFFSTTPSLTTFLWWLPGFVILGVTVLADKFIARHKAESSAFLENADFETFLLVRNV
jgi:hypothetical protein